MSLDNTTTANTAYDQYFTKLRPVLASGITEELEKHDEELVRTILKIINASDSLCQRHKYDSVLEEVAVLEKIISMPNYFSRHLKDGTEQEKQIIRNIIDAINEFKLVTRLYKNEAAALTLNKPQENNNKGRLLYDDSLKINRVITNKDKTTRERLPN